MAYTGENLLIGTCLGLASLFVVFSFRQYAIGRSHTARIEKDGGSVFLSTYLMEFVYWCLWPVAWFCVRARVSPNFISFLCLALGIVAGIFCAYGELALAGWVSVLSSIMDALDGMVARASQVASDAGEVFDATVDRVTEFAFCFGLLIYYRDDVIGMLIVMLALFGSVMVSYSTAKAEALQMSVPRGMMRRAERAVYLGGAALLAPLVSAWFDPNDPHPRFYLMQGALLLVGAVASISAIYRFYWLYSELKAQGK